MSASTPRILQSADEAPCGSLIHRTDVYGTKVHTLRLWNGNGWNLDRGGPLSVSEGWPWGSRANGPATLFAEGLTEAECRHLSGLSAADAIAWCEQRAKNAAFVQALDKASATVATWPKWKQEVLGGTAKRPQPGDVVPWAEVEDGCLYFVPGDESLPFYMQHNGRFMWLLGPSDSDLERVLTCNRGVKGMTGLAGNNAILIARDLGTDPEAWRRAMREWTANGNRPNKVPAPLPDLAALIDERNTALELADYRLNELRKAETALYAASRAERAAEAAAVQARKERNEARADWAEQTADAARLRIALQEAQQRLVQAHEDIDTLIAKQTAADFEIAALKQDRTWVQEGRELERVLASGSALLAQHHARIVGRLRGGR